MQEGRSCGKLRALKRDLGMDKIIRETGSRFRLWFKTIGYRKNVPVKGTLKKILLLPSNEATKGGSSKRPTGSKTGHLKRKKESSSAMDSNPIQTSAFTLVVAEMPYFIIHSKSASGNDASAVSTAEADPRKSAPMELVKNKAEAKVTLFRAQPSFPNMGQLNDLLVKSLQTDLSKILSAHDFSNSLPTKLKELPSKFNELAEETVTSLTSQVAELKTLQWGLPAEFVSVPTQVKVIQAKLKTLDALPSLLHKVTNALNQFAQAITSKKTKDDSVPSAGQAALNLLRGRRTQIKPPSLSYSKEKMQIMQT
ncbi:hypothetical protein Tco_1122594 [Tanacetum coccineum]|uniref:Uncharacterized protein n=1 Tax=Tanacetum coccineum TaxID=301880 RepID=A0ABQ5J4N7_9ASTR